ncbi:unnamed protein product [Ascophyllum nodosum]
MDEEDWEAEDEEDNDDGDDDVDDDADGDADDHGGDGDDSNRSKAKARKDGGSTAGSVQGSPKKKRKGAAKATREARDRSAIEIVTAQDCSFNPVPWSRRQKRTSANTVDMLAARRQGFNSRRSMAASLGGSYIPNRFCHPLSKSSQRMFCGRFSTSGGVLLTACQEAVIKLYDSESVYQWSTKNVVDPHVDCPEELSGMEYRRFRRGRYRRTTADDKLVKGAPSPIKTINCIGTGWSVISTDFSPDEKWLAYSSWCPYVHLCNTRGEYELHEALDFKPEDDQFCLFSIQFSPNNTHIVGGASDNHVYLYSLERKERIARIKAHLDHVNAVAYADQGSQVVLSGGDDCVIKIWDLRSPDSAVGGLCGHQAGVTCITAKGDGHHFISNGKDQTMKLWDMRKMLDPNHHKMVKAALVRQLDYRLPVSRAMRPKKTSKTADESVKTFHGHQVLQTLIRCYFSPAHTTGQRFVMSGSSDGRVCIWDILTGEMVQSLSWHRDNTRDVSWHPHLPLIASFSWDASVGLWGYSGHSETSQDTDPRGDRSA